jgi:hypothetical protein
MSTQPNASHDHGLISGFHASWTLVQHSGPLHIRMYLANLRCARDVCKHLTEHLDKLILLAEAKIAHYESEDAAMKRAHEAH